MQDKHAKTEELKSTMLKHTGRYHNIYFGIISQVQVLKECKIHI